MEERSSQSIVSSSQVFFTHVFCGLVLAIGFWVAHNVYSISLVSDPANTLRLIWAIKCPVVVLLFSCFRQKPEKCSYLKAFARGLLGLPTGALLNALGALALGAPVGLQYLEKTINWSLLMSLLTFVPAASVYGSSWTDWHRIFACTKPKGSLDFMLCLPAHGAVIGAWFGSWPMPLDWERPWQGGSFDLACLFGLWLVVFCGFVLCGLLLGLMFLITIPRQDWPICVSYGAMAGYVAGMVGSFGLALMHGRQKQLKAE